MSTSAPGRHRAQGRSNPVDALSAALARSARPAVAATATVAAAGGMVAGLAGPAVAAPVAPNAPAADSVVLSGANTMRVSYGQQLLDSTPAVATPKFTYQRVALTSRVATAQAVATRAAAAPSAARATLAAAYTAPAPAAAPARAAAAPAQAAAAPAAAAPVAARTVNAAPSAGVLGIAAGLSGIPYLWGGTTPGGFDCSGFTQYVFRQIGVSLPRTAGAQRAATRYVSSPQPGDLVFFGTYHVGIYAGNGMMYDSPSSGQTTGLHRIWSSSVTYGRVG